MHFDWTINPSLVIIVGGYLATAIWYFRGQTDGLKNISDSLNALQSVAKELQVLVRDHNQRLIRLETLDEASRRK